MRIWTFGCSFTSYWWPTWADIIVEHARAEGHRAENWGRLGCSNQYIFTKIWEADARYQFGKDDWVFVCWTAMPREDKYINGEWVSTMLDDHEYFKYFEKYKDYAHYGMRDCAMITSTQLALQELGVNQFHFNIMNFDPPRNDPNELSDLDVIDQYKLRFDSISIQGMLGWDNWFNPDFDMSRPKTRAPWDKEARPDWHPTPAEHRAVVETNIKHKVDFLKGGLNKSARDLVTTWQSKLQDAPKPIMLKDLGWASSRSKSW